MADEVLTGQDWGRILAKAWREPEFYNLLQTDPTRAITQWAGQQTPPRTITTMVILPRRPEHIPPEYWDDVNPFPPSCC
jgi:hypothetical protein